MEETKNEKEQMKGELERMGRGDKSDMPISVEDFGKERKNG